MQMWEKKVHYCCSCCSHSKCVENSDTFGSELAGKVLLSFVRSSLKWYKEAKDEDKTSHCEIFLQWPRVLSPVCLTFFFPQGEVETVMGTEWVLMQSRQSEWAVVKVWLHSKPAESAKKMLLLGKLRKGYYKSSQKAALIATSFRKGLGSCLEMSLAPLQTHNIHIYRHELRRPKRWYGHSGLRQRAIRSSAGPVPLVSQSHILGKMPAAWFEQLILCQKGSFKGTHLKKLN